MLRIEQAYVLQLADIGGSKFMRARCCAFGAQAADTRAERYGDKIHYDKQ